MREILFRGRRLGKIDEDFVYGSLGVISTDLVAIYQCEEYYEDIITLVDIGTVGQYTGLNDKNGKKIFEGDIVSISGDFKGIYTCVWEEYHFDYELENKTMRCCLACVYSDDIKVIGNIHDNPELLKGGAE